MVNGRTAVTPFPPRVAVPTTVGVPPLKLSMNVMVQAGHPDAESCGASMVSYSGPACNVASKVMEDEDPESVQGVAV